MFSVKKNWQLQLQVSNICHINNMFRTCSLSLMYCVNLAELTHISLLLMRVLKIKLYEIGVSRCIILASKNRRKEPGHSGYFSPVLRKM